METTLKFTVGRLLCGQVRDFLKECEFRGLGIRWIESSGWIEREFVIRGEPEALRKIHRAFQKWAIDNDLTS